MLLCHWMAVRAGGEKRELVSGLCHGEAFDIWPRKPWLPHSGSDLRIAESFHPNEFGGTEWPRKIHQFCQRKARPCDRHAPGFDTAVTICPLFQRHFPEKFVDANLDRFVNHAVNLDQPRSDRQ